jgi:hypothetical protein
MESSAKAAGAAIKVEKNAHALRRLVGFMSLSHANIVVSMRGPWVSLPSFRGIFGFATNLELCIPQPERAGHGLETNRGAHTSFGRTAFAAGGVQPSGSAPMGDRRSSSAAFAVIPHNQKKRLSGYLRSLQTLWLIAGSSTPSICAAAIAVFQIVALAHAEPGLDLGSRGRPEGMPVAAQLTRETGTLIGIVTLTCALNVTGCREQPYQVPLLVTRQHTAGLPMRVTVSSNGNFSISLAPGNYTIASGDTRSGCCLPILLELVAVRINSGHTTWVNVRFQPGPQLPKR